MLPMCKQCKRSKFQRIVDGWKNLIVRDPQIEELALSRAKFCAVCSKNKYNVCTICNCPLPAKTRSPEEKCDRGLW